MIMAETTTMTTIRMVTCIGRHHHGGEREKEIYQRKTLKKKTQCFAQALVHGAKDAHTAFITDEKALAIRGETDALWLENFQTAALLVNR